MLVVKLATGGFPLALIETLSAKMRIFRAPEFLGTAFLLAVLAMLVTHLLDKPNPWRRLRSTAQLINLLAAILLLLAFAMLAQRRVLSLIDLFACRALRWRARRASSPWPLANRISTGPPA